ncbi:hypothetical protein [Dactylosporangium sp. CA-139066]|uniref:hypothetical protein n=1 Tax=Dactylosporangium sp. CA-139066 TaxID=3239930 RepID=UPI003D8AF029
MAPSVVSAAEVAWMQIGADESRHELGVLNRPHRSGRVFDDERRHTFNVHRDRNPEPIN